MTMTITHFSNINHKHLAPDWMKNGLNEIYSRIGDEIHCVNFGFWTENYHDDNNSYSEKASLHVVFKKFNEEENECQLDEIPSVRKIERKAVQLWDNLPLCIDSENDVMGDVNFTINKNLVEFSINYEGEDFASIVMAAEYKDGDWHCYDEITIFEEISETLRISGTTERLLAAIDLTSYGFEESAKNHEIINATIDENDGIVLRYKPGLFEHYNPSRG